MRRYDTSIKTILQEKNRYLQETGASPVFLSDWDSDYNSIRMPSLNYHNICLSDVQKYYFWTDEEGYRDTVQTFLYSQFSLSTCKDEFTIGSNGTSSIMLALTALKETGNHRALVLTPVYFSTLNMLDALNFDVVEIRLSDKNNFKIDTEQIDKIIISESLDTLIVTNPFFGCGTELDLDTINRIVDVCNKHDVCLVMDYIYGGMSWKMDKQDYYIFNCPIYNAVRRTNHYVFIESISKRVFLNGAKFALVFASSFLMRRILRLSVFMVGSMAYQQVSLVPQIYSDSSIQSLSSLILDNSQIAQSRYRMIQTMLLDTHITLSKADCGYFALLSIPNKLHIDDTLFAISILNKTGVLTTPHSRYLYKENGLYSFRINLLLDQKIIIDGISKIRNLK